MFHLFDTPSYILNFLNVKVFYVFCVPVLGNVKCIISVVDISVNIFYDISNYAIISLK